MNAALFQLFVRSLLSKLRILALVVLGAIAVLVAALLANDNASTQEVVDFLSDYGLTVAVPIASLVFASAAFGDMQEDRTLVYIFLKPVARWKPVIMAFLASLVSVIPIVVGLLTVAALIADDSTALGIASAATVGVVVYSALFTALGLLTKRPLLWGLAYILVWEGFIAGAGDVASNVAMRSYTRSVLARVTDTSLGLGDSNLTTAIVVPAVVTAVALGFATWRLAHMDID